MDIEVSEVMQELSAAMERLVARLEQCENAQRGQVEKITAAVDTNLDSTRREMDLERRLAEAEQSLAMLQAAGPIAESRVAARKTLPAATVQLLAKQGIDAGDSIDVQSLDAALAGLSVEQRIAVKSQMMRTGTLTL